MAARNPEVFTSFSSVRFEGENDIQPSNPNNEIIEIVPNCYVVSLTEDHRKLELIASKKVYDKIHADPNLAKQYRMAHALRSQPTLGLARGERVAFLMLLGNSFAAAFSGDAEMAEKFWNKAADYLEAQRTNVARIWFVGGGALVFVVFLFAVLLYIGNRGEWTNASEVAETGLTLATFPFGLCFLFGIVGAIGSMLSRLTTMPSDIEAGWLIHVVDGASRVFVGGFFGVLGGMGFAGNVFLGFLEPAQASYGIVLCLVAAISGISERLIPSLVKSFEGRADKEHSPAGGDEPPGGGGDDDDSDEVGDERDQDEETETVVDGEVEEEADAGEAEAGAEEPPAVEDAATETPPDAEAEQAADDDENA